MKGISYERKGDLSIDVQKMLNVIGNQSNEDSIQMKHYFILACWHKLNMQRVGEDVQQ